MNNVKNQSQIWPDVLKNIETPVLPETEYSWNEQELEQKAEFLITRCYQLLAEIQEKRDRMKLHF